MENDCITNLVVGQSMTVPLGVPVGQNISSAEVSGSLRWNGGSWTVQQGILDRVKMALHKSPTRLTLPFVGTPAATKLESKNRTLRIAAFAIGGAVFLALGMFLSPVELNLMQRNAAPIPDDLSVVPKADGAKDAKVEAVRSVDEPWIRPAQDQTQSTGVGVIIPVVPGSLTSPNVSAAEGRTTALALPTPLPALEPIKAAPAPAQRTATDVKPVDKKAAEAVILDVEAAPPAAKAQTTPVAQVNTGKPAVKDSPKNPNAGLVALTPDGKSAVFANPTTRLPEKFGIGEKLPSGETLRSIDANTGTVKTDAREYRLE